MKARSILKISLTIPMILVLSMPIALAGTGGGLSPEHHERCMRYGKLAVEVAHLKKSGYDQNSAGASLIGSFQALRTPTLAKKILDITRHVYNNPMSADKALTEVYELCASGRLDSM